MSCLDLEGFEDTNAQTGRRELNFYIVTIEEGSRSLSIRRNYEGTILKIEFIILHISSFYWFSYGFGLIHLIADYLESAATTPLLDAGTLSNLPSGFKHVVLSMR